MDDVDKLYRQHRQQIIDGFLIAVATMICVGLIERFLHVDLIQLGIGAITGNAVTNGVNSFNNTRVLNSPANNIGTAINLPAPANPSQPPTMGQHP